MSSSSDDEPDWLVEQASARKEHATLRAIDSDDDSIAGSDSPKGDGSGGAKGKGKGKDKAGAGPGGTEAKAKSKGRAPPSTRLPLQLAPKVRRDCFLVEARDANLDLSGDFGCIGKLHVRKSGAGAGSSSQGAAGGESEGRVAELRQTLMLDLKGKVYDADIVPCNTLCLVAVDGSKAKVEAVFSDFVQLAAPRDSIFDMQEVAGGSFDDDFFDDADVLSNVGDDDDDEALGPLKEHRGKAKGGKKAGGRKPAGKAGAKRKSSGGGGGAAKKARK